MVIANLNDAKPLSRTWRAIQADYPAVDFMLRSHSPAWSYPSCFSFEDPNDAIDVNRSSYMEAWRAAAEILRPRYGIPFASGVCHPHRDVLTENSELVTDEELERYMRAKPLAGMEVMVMPPGSRWSTGDGFDCRTENRVTDVAAYVTARAKTDRDWLDRLYRQEAKATVSFQSFEAYFEQLLKSPVLVPFRAFLAVTWVFEVIQEGATQYWTVDFRTGRIGRHPSPPTSYTSLMRVPPAILDEALRDRLFGNIDIAKRWHVHVGSGGMTAHLVAAAIVSLYEAGYLTLGNLMQPRVLAELIARRSEVVDYMGLCWSLLRKDEAALAKAVTEPL